MRCCECGRELPEISILCIQDNKVCCGEDCSILHVNKTVLGVDLSTAYPEEKKLYVETIRTGEIM